MQAPPQHAYPLNAQIKRAKNVGFGDQTDDAKRKEEMKIEKTCSASLAASLGISRAAPVTNTYKSATLLTS
jgi:hypothetical protein